MLITHDLCFYQACDAQAFPLIFKYNMLSYRREGTQRTKLNQPNDLGFGCVPT